MAMSAGDSGGAGTAPIKRVSWDIGTGSARTAGGSVPAPSPSWDIGTGAARTTGGTYAPPIAPAPAPRYYAPSSYTSVPSRPIAPVQNYQPSYSQPAYGGGTSLPMQQQNFAPPPPPEPPRPQFAPGGRQEFMNMFSPEQQQMTEQSWLGGDSDYTSQVGMYQKALDDFVRRITGRIEGFKTDATQAIQGNEKNEGMSADSLGADFGARGLSYSGLFSNSQDKLRDRYKEGRANIGKNRDTNIQNANEQQADYTAENEISKQNAKRSALMRMAAQQQLLDANY